MCYDSDTIMVLTECGQTNMAFTEFVEVAVWDCMMSKRAFDLSWMCLFVDLRRL